MVRSPIMAKKKPEQDDDVRVTVLTIRGRRKWRAWLDRGAKFCRINTSSLVDIAVVKYLREQGFSEPPPER